MLICSFVVKFVKKNFSARNLKGFSLSRAEWRQCHSRLSMAAQHFANPCKARLWLMGAITSIIHASGDNPGHSVIGSNERAGA